MHKYGINLCVPFIEEIALLIKKSDIAVIGNPLIRSWHKKAFSVQEQRFLLFTIVDMQKRSTFNQQQENLLSGSITVEAFANLLGIKKDGVYSELKNVAGELTKENIKIDNQKLVGWYPLFSKIEYYKTGARIDWEYNHNLKDLLINLRENFTKYQLEKVIFLQSQYAIQLYQLFKSYINLRNEITIELEELKHILGLYEYNSKDKIIGDKYSKISDIKKIVLDVAKRNLENTNTCDIQFDYILNKEGGRSYKNITFSFWYKDAKQDLFQDLLPVYTPRFNLSQTIIMNKLKDYKKIPTLTAEVYKFEEIIKSQGFDPKQKLQQHYLKYFGFISKTM